MAYSLKGGTKMAKTHINLRTKQVELLGECSDAELAKAAIQVGYIKARMGSMYEVLDCLRPKVPKGFRIIFGRQHLHENQDNVIRIGQVLEQDSGVECPLFITRKSTRGPHYSGRKPLKPITIYLPEIMIDWLRSQPTSAGEATRNLIKKAMDNGS
jgi:hypothetical protein